MKKYRLPFFIVLALLLAAIIAYIPFQSATKERTEKADFKMDVAIVNLDEPVDYNGKKYNFGEEFKKSLENDDSHRFHLVDTAEAEDGIADKRYNMAITIPNDFTKRALSMDKVSPEPIELSYKLNESDNEITKAQAQKISGDLLNSFNQKVIDVFFASVIGNLQSAQNNVKGIVKKQDQLAATYTSDIHDPLRDYSSTLTQIEDSTNGTRNSFVKLNKGLNNFAQEAQKSVNGTPGLTNTMTTMQQYITDGNDGLNSLISKITENNDSLMAGNIEESLEYIKDQQKQLNESFAADTGLLTEIQTSLNSTRDEISRSTVTLKERIYNDLSKEASDLINESLNDSLSDPKNEAKLNALFSVPKGTIEKNILNSIDQLPSLDKEQLKDLDVSDTTKDQLRKIMAAAKQYAVENKHPIISNGQLSINDYMQQMKQKLATEGAVIADEVKIPAQEAGSRTFAISAPNGFVTKNIVLMLPNGVVLNNIQPGKIDLPTVSQGKMKVYATFVLAEYATDILAPVHWSWSINSHSEETNTALMKNMVTRVSLPANSLNTNEAPVPSQDAPIIEEDAQETTIEKPEDNKDTGKTNESNQTTDKNEESTNVPKKSEEKSQNIQSNSSKNTTIKKKQSTKAGDSDEKESPEKPKSTETKTITDNAIHHEVTTILAAQEDIPTQLVMSIWNYQRLQALLNLYYSIDVTNPEQFAQLSYSSFEQVGSANADSLYYALSNKGMKEFIISTLKQTLIDSTTAKLTNDMESLNEQVISYNDALNGIAEKIPNLSQQLNDSKEVAEQQVADIDVLIPTAAEWKEASGHLADTGSKLTEQNEKGGKISIELEDGLSDLLTASDTVASRAEEASLQADTVYDTFDGINQKAEQIKIGGTNIAHKADQLADNLIQKVSNDNDYASNFSNVLANSKIGNKSNEALYAFLSSPIDMSKSSIKNARDTRSTFYLLIISSFLALFTAYVIAGFKRFSFKKSDFEDAAQQSIMATNLPITLFTTVIGAIEGLIVGAISLSINKSAIVSPSIWMALTALCLVLFVLAATYLLRQWKMVGMFIILLVISMYLFFTEALGFDFERSHIIQQFSRLSPLHYLEKAISTILNTNSASLLTISIIVILGLIFFVLNLFVFKFRRPKEEVMYEA
ncbi:type VII secretion protein EsaA [Rummeliibacillus stabekisii]|uniref:Type VII secretion system accessory factor EsaA n=1 Tax=Rummeliibacillus stabekisii TaxID=241244 RepID=A0A143HCH6_9BACL|nr:type VII secretion protein EsaA [Rummeliibacillus stabekisii]AMW99402.1 hypothetical protein ATY39_07930 [Rummeliibacillus stabekisii]